MGAACAVLGFGLGGWLAAASLLRPLYDLLVAPRFTAPWPSLGQMFGVGRWPVIGVAVAAMALAVWYTRGLPDPKGIWAWWRNGIALGLIGVGAWTILLAVFPDAFRPLLFP